MLNCGSIAQDVITIDVEKEDLEEDFVEILEVDESFDELVRVLGKRYLQEVLEVGADEENLEELEVFEENFVDTDIIQEISDDDDELLSCQYFTVNEWVTYYQLASYFCEVEIYGTEEQIEIEDKKTGLADISIEIVDLTES